MLIRRETPSSHVLTAALRSASASSFPTSESTSAAASLDVRGRRAGADRQAAAAVPPADGHATAAAVAAATTGAGAGAGARSFSTSTEEAAVVTSRGPSAREMEKYATAIKVQGSASGRGGEGMVTVEAEDTVEVGEDENVHAGLLSVEQQSSML